MTSIFLVIAGENTVLKAIFSRGGQSKIVLTASVARYKNFHE